jgi:hypothetical protein
LIERTFGVDAEGFIEKCDDDTEDHTKDDQNADRPPPRRIHAHTLLSSAEIEEQGRSTADPMTFYRRARDCRPAGKSNVGFCGKATSCQDTRTIDTYDEKSNQLYPSSSTGAILSRPSDIKKKKMSYTLAS